MDGKKVVGGIGIYKFNPEKASQQISLAREMGLLGYSLFSYTTFLNNTQFGKRIKEFLSPESTRLPSEFKQYLRSR